MKKWILISVLMINDLLAGCLACWNLRRVQIAMSDRKVYDVYMQWNDEWMNTEDYRNRDEIGFPHTVFRDIQNQSVRAYRSKDLRKVNYPKEGLVVSLSDVMTFPIKDIISIHAMDGEYNGTGGAGFLNVVTNRMYRLLLKPPFAQIHRDNQVEDDYWLIPSVEPPSTTRIS